MLLSHEIGHALGLADVDAQAGPQGFFLEDNYNAASPVATLNNSWAGLVNTTNPVSSPLSINTIPSIVFATSGVNILMESFGLGGQFGNLTPMSNDDYGMRQFLSLTRPRHSPGKRDRTSRIVRTRRDGNIPSNTAGVVTQEIIFCDATGFSYAISKKA